MTEQEPRFFSREKERKAVPRYTFTPSVDDEETIRRLYSDTHPTVLLVYASEHDTAATNEKHLTEKQRYLNRAHIFRQLAREKGARAV